MLLSEEKCYESKVSCSKRHYEDPALARTLTSRSFGPLTPSHVSTIMDSEECLFFPLAN